MRVSQIQSEVPKRIIKRKDVSIINAFNRCLCVESELKNIREIFEKAKGGDRMLFRLFTRGLFKPLYRYVYLRIGNKAESDDLFKIFYQGL